MKRTARLSLRRIAVHVDEPRPGKFEWVLNEALSPSSESWTPLDRAKRPVDSYRKAMALGLLALQALVDDLDAGPRAAQEDGLQHEDEDNDDAPAARGSRRAQDGKAATPGRRTAFGFGLIG
ncbi:hypothetical protein [Variovorax paradoxus]|jgi:hypothetical protein|uniref:Uncharacterized protein n=1 Tax=Variovorax paradoxus TaxID=34073 RepID=A0A679JSV5_VARPD|nr:hypothetical protein VVAX_05614 [Variovorax paradoxus]